MTKINETPVSAKIVKTSKVKSGRPTVMTSEVCRRIEEVAALGGSVEEMAIYGLIHKDTIYSYLKEHPEYSDKIDALRERPILKARNTIIAGLDQPENAKWYLERKRRNEFSSKIRAETTTRIIHVDL